MTSNYQLKHNEVAILWYETREVEIIEVEDLHKIEDLDIHLDELGYDLSQISYMS